MILLLPVYKKEKINYFSEKESNRIQFKKLKSELKEKRRAALEEDYNNPQIITKKFLWFNRSVKVYKKKEIVDFFKKQLQHLKRTNKENKLQAKINFMAAVSRNKEIKENANLMKKSKSNLHEVLYNFAKLPYEDKKNSLVVQEISPSRETKFLIKRRVFNDLDAYGDQEGDRVYASEKDIVFTSIKFSEGIEKIPMVYRYSGQCVPIFLDKVRADTFEKFSTENEHHIMIYSARIRETKEPKKGMNININKKSVMIILGVLLVVGYLGYRYYNGGF
jgi:hypothetical protein